ncbi:MAG: sigma 54-interacting transcriptional regulator [Deltaproteobacteria bacterium]|nr:sigma 54-interacting transcriptional regulator [Deltaproteobacteria bacterium]MBW1924476.1 sigma 54-interacting transcriptional regulator [Deltaproteobacteria bacterium]MBW1948932.1 sigma 54-interacting transcriptional regulator [Deltaproteobacteria bacterium]MBW2007150.1 sigma 54-interacting transcriptional regulator [Deltaproteobacteria bacterium]MBW2102276.1 sigma 54-interacting transcriptional regulator [Deltaproteobacteria bacterium]
MTTPYFLDEPSPERFEAVIQSISDGVMTVDSQWRITCFNKSAERISGVPREEAMGCPCYEVLKSNICRGTCAIQYTIETRKPVVNLAIYLMNKQGFEVPVSISTAVFRDKHGNLKGGVVTFRDLRQVEEFRKEIKKSYSYGDIISKSKKVKKILEILPTIAESDSTVLITGESGTGKEIFARAIHGLSHRNKKPFVPVNCGGFPETLIESELFGHETGAFTGATRARQGRFARAEGGTLFLDEIGDLPLPLQVKLLRVLQDKTYEPLGGTRSLKADVRIITATNRELHNMVADGTFRQDLFYRINVINLEIPPLRERLEDVPLLVEHFITRFSALHNKDIQAISHEALDILMSYDYPGNIRELENIIEHGCVLCPGGLIHIKHLPDSLRPTLNSFVSADTFEEIERQFIIFMLKKNKWNRLATAREMGIHKTTLFRKVKKLGIRLPDKDGRHKAP